MCRLSLNAHRCLVKDPAGRPTRERLEGAFRAEAGRKDSTRTIRHLQNLSLGEQAADGPRSTVQLRLSEMRLCRPRQWGACWLAGRLCCILVLPVQLDKNRGITRRRRATQVRRDRAFKGRQFDAEVILWAVRWYLMFPISYRDLELMLLDRGGKADHTTISTISSSKTIGT
jgi:hypothetical protein